MTAVAASSGSAAPLSPTRHLYVLRHAKSSWDDPFLSDAERPLSARGQAAVAALHRHFGSIGLSVQLVICSPSRRTRDTWAGVADAVGGEPEVRFVGAVYGGSAPALISLLHTVPEQLTSVLLIGHNPGSEELIRVLTGKPVVDRMPTGGFATLTVDVGWPHLGPGTAQLASLQRPRDLPK
jgi:phosphohistidine phosphatase